MDFSVTVPAVDITLANIYFSQSFGQLEKKVSVFVAG